MAGPVLVRSDTVRVGYLGRGGTATPALWLHAPQTPVRTRDVTIPADAGTGEILADPTNPHGVDITGPTPADALASTVPAGMPIDTIVTADGRTVDPSADPPKDFVAVEGLDEIRCGVAAALVACDTPALLAWTGGEIESTLIAQRLGVEHAVDLPRVRRTACELATAGRPDRKSVV